MTGGKKVFGRKLKRERKQKGEGKGARNEAVKKIEMEWKEC